MLVRECEVFTGLAEHVEAALVGHGHRVDRRRRHDDSGLDRGTGRAAAATTR
jgi:hypothetical protein